MKKKTLKKWHKLGFVIIAGLVFVDIGLIYNITHIPFWWGVGALSGSMLSAMIGCD